jgi:hypothetical protein
MKDNIEIYLNSAIVIVLVIVCTIAFLVRRSVLRLIDEQDEESNAKKKNQELTKDHSLTTKD